ncbi:5-formyltetrahydrofolate cyclo-ligase [Aurantiacibacter gangjinensis]|uniref:5-formyltetrahydrofolate cyclo-ligase n=1 Tax=Aurantiacibacter gangjinensis TaxID=502682 RepID=A0A0G9MTY1_9SPHN|nr:5-formyltetrahydrofolate cyclo-ligase [Aurantiacibacter gangjinensis]APE28578.1 5-formyltetrahydrofolate cyclo-ligase [Aurantiacibacter gangjinensis]KLE32768.1 5-formyltetrahydrofolate cyclo-ligase [Aurantiacibacter gangjinensis]
MSDTKTELRTRLRQLRREHAAALPQEVSALVFRAPPGPVRAMVPENAILGLYHAADGEAPAAGYARWFQEAGHRIALPRITAMDGGMTFHEHTDPFTQSDLEEGRKGLMQPAADAPEMVPDVIFVPLVGFTATGARLGQGGGFYDRWLAAHPETIAIGLGWDVQEVDELPMEDHDMPLHAIVTTTRVLGPFGDHFDA